MNVLNEYTLQPLWYNVFLWQPPLLRKVIISMTLWKLVVVWEQSVIEHSKSALLYSKDWLKYLSVNILCPQLSYTWPLSSVCLWATIRWLSTTDVTKLLEHSPSSTFIPVCVCVCDNDLRTHTHRKNHSGWSTPEKRGSYCLFWPREGDV